VSDIEIAYAATVKVIYNFWPVFAFIVGGLLWETVTEPKKARIRKSNNIR
tara:strand:+ start:158 stop:307 length:150 start_codon:yes stop_codon:yes gene_type:complete